MVAIPLAGKATAMAQRGLGVALAFVVVAAAVAAPIALDLWAMVAADGDGIRWRNRLATRRLGWAEVAAFEPGPVSIVVRRTDGRTFPIRALGFRYMGSKQMATQRVRMLERLHARS